MKHLLALDQGTTSSRSIVFDAQGRVVALAQQEFAQHFPKPGWVEHDADEIWRTQLATARAALRKAKLGPRDIAAIGVTNQRETTVAWDRRTGEPLARAIVWQDRRTAGECERLVREGAAERIRARTGLVCDPYFSATKMRWLVEHVPAVRKAARAGWLALGTVDAWLIAKLTEGNEFATDVSNASRTLLLDTRTGRWSAELLELFGVSFEALPQVRASNASFGDTRLFGGEIPIHGVAGDQQAALFGQACTESGLAKATYGTGAFLLLHTGEKRQLSKHGMLSTVAWQLAGERLEHALEGSVFSAGSTVQWLRDGLGLIGRSSDVEALAASVPDTAGVHLVPAFTGLGAPHWDPQARALVCGITRGTTKAHVARAALEAIAFQCAEVLDAMQRDARTRLRELRVDGGASRNDLLMQFQSDVLGLPVLRPAVTETTAWGAAALAALGAGVVRDRATLARRWRAAKRFEPRMKAAERERRLGEWARALERARR
ncbi:MAG: glycerol kinase GlpK [Planctomycetota bacterium]|nr:glycerol kinase GlpK [Planctomycetota bacterium]